MKQKSSKKNITQVPFLRFSRTQRRAILFISVLATAGMIVFKSGIMVLGDDKSGQPFVASEITRELVARDTANYSTPHTQHTPAYTHTTYPNRKTAPETSFQSGTITHFDPNHVTFEQLIEMGLREKAARNLVNYRSKGGKFRKPEDLGKLYGLKSEEVEKLIPYVKFEHEAQKDLVNETQAPETAPSVTQAKSRPFQMMVDVNLADSLTWTMLPGIGAKRASAILRFRSKLGGFTSIEQVAETYGLPDSIFQKIKPDLTYSSTPMQQLSLNASSEAQLKSHPYINWQIAKLIVAYRNQHGPYQQVDNLLKIHAIEKDWFARMRPYLKADQVPETLAAR